MYTGGTPVAPVGVQKRQFYDQHHSEKSATGLKHKYYD
jgi:hypothetical protein